MNILFVSQQIWGVWERANSFRIDGDTGTPAWTLAGTPPVYLPVLQSAAKMRTR